MRLTSIRFKFFVFIVLLTATCATLNAQRPAVRRAAEAKAATDTTPPKKKDTGTIGGRTTHGGAPAPNVTVTLEKAGSRYSNEKPLARTRTDADGRFRFTNIAAGLYNVTSHAPAFVGERTFSFEGGKAVTVDANETIDNVDFELERGGVITGRIVDAEGAPIISETVSLTPVDEKGQPLQRSFNTPFASSDDRGVYRIYGIPAGRYLVGAGRDEGGIRIGGSNRFYTRTFHPETSDQTKATAIEVTAESEAVDINITLKNTGRTFTATGRIVDADTGEPIPNLAYAYGVLQGQGDNRYMGGYGYNGSRTNARGEFRLENLAANEYAVFVGGSETVGERYSDMTRFEIKDADVKGLEVKMHAGASIGGFVTLEGTTDKAAFAKLSQLQINADDSTQGSLRMPRNLTSPVAANGAFRIGGLRPGATRLYFNNVPSVTNLGLSLVRIERDGVPIAERGIEVKAGEAVNDIRIVVAYGKSVVRGTINIIGELPPDATMMVYARHPNSTQFPAGVQTRVDVNRRFRIENLPAGEYEITLTAYAPPAPGRPPLRIPPVRQLVSVSGTGDTQIALTLDLTPKPQGETNQ
ncbi:MAG: carboxypeptidase regulatory-like domain-containing protein [Pyrinomonadaceae bacterium MAG19_C2-C3]|nr:carboxypeptidase regulatory-like domain-containing protein [Pyrinomonadaceae bacterium MAG19_C2-C3]